MGRARSRYDSETDRVRFRSSWRLVVELTECRIARVPLIDLSRLKVKLSQPDGCAADDAGGAARRLADYRDAIRSVSLFIRLLRDLRDQGWIHRLPVCLGTSARPDTR